MIAEHNSANNFLSRTTRCSKIYLRLLRLSNHRCNTINNSHNRCNNRHFRCLNSNSKVDIIRCNNNSNNSSKINITHNNFQDHNNSLLNRSHNNPL